MKNDELANKLTDAYNSVSDAQQKVYKIYSELYSEGNQQNSYLQLAQRLETIADLLTAKENELEDD